MNLSSLMMMCMGAAAVVVCIWFLFAVDIPVLMKRSRGSIFVKVADPMLTSDWFAAMLYCGFLPLGLGFFALELATRRLERLRGADPDGYPHLTRRAKVVADLVQQKHFASVSEKAFLLCMLYLTFACFTKVTPVVLTMISGFLKSASLGMVLFIFYLVGITMFLLPPVPGVPVYMAAGTMVAGKCTPHMGFVGAIFFCSLLSLVLKLNACAIQQKVIGGLMGRTPYIQQLVGVHTISIK